MRAGSSPITEGGLTSVPLLMEPGLFRAVEELCRDSLVLTNYSQIARTRILGVITNLRAQASVLYGHDTPEIIALLHLLRRADAVEAAPRRGPVRELEEAEKLNPAQAAAAGVINEIWLSWGRCLVMSGQKYDGEGVSGGSGKALTPLDAMSQRVWEVWQERYVPWCTIAKRKRVGPTNAADVTIRIVAEGYHVDTLARMLGVEEERIIKTLRCELNRFNDLTPVQKSQGLLPTIGKPHDQED